MPRGNGNTICKNGERLMLVRISKHSKIRVRGLHTFRISFTSSNAADSLRGALRGPLVDDPHDPELPSLRLLGVDDIHRSVLRRLPRVASVTAHLRLRRPRPLRSGGSGQRSSRLWRDRLERSSWWLRVRAELPDEHRLPAGAEFPPSPCITGPLALPSAPRCGVGYRS